MTNTFPGLTRTQVNTLIAAYAAPVAHTHDDRYYTETEINSLLGGYTTLTGAQTLTNKTLTTPSIGSFANAGHSHQDAAGGGTLDAVAVASGTLANARVNWAAPGAIGSTTPSTGKFTFLTTADDLGAPAGADVMKELARVQRSAGYQGGLSFGYFVRSAGEEYGSYINTLSSTYPNLVLGVPGKPWAFYMNTVGYVALGGTSALQQVNEQLVVAGNVALGGSNALASNTFYARLIAANNVFNSTSGDVIIAARQAAGKAVAIATGDSSAAIYFVVNSSGKIAMGTFHTPTYRVSMLESNAADTTTSDILRIGRNAASGTPAAGFGGGAAFTLQSSTTADQNAARIEALWNDATHASRKADLVLSAYDASARREGLRIRGTGSAAAVGFLGAAPAGQQTGGAATAGGTWTSTEQTMLQRAYDALRTFGFLN